MWLQKPRLSVCFTLVSCHRFVIMGPPLPILECYFKKSKDGREAFAHPNCKSVSVNNTTTTTTTSDLALSDLNKSPGCFGSHSKWG